MLNRLELVDDEFEGKSMANCEDTEADPTQGFSFGGGLCFSGDATAERS